MKRERKQERREIGLPVVRTVCVAAARERVNGAAAETRFGLGKCQISTKGFVY